ncbi:uncharacterized protein TRIADDRAFT_59606 [Trichoplax adhaerens]|uniref:Fibronectin type-III domain-containing protein n=1 Tax=Trichoplax adhaerens TaxID=10228 RepID=B3S5G4_TRIAD|nr:predicted protein [Trichoplax adhaerens]EDV21909.1 predicted protein [Trichoplax adhaerens]|eukprot:XP_002115546.1 predicted protein [Trichoplax adhaerens]
MAIFNVTWILLSFTCGILIQICFGRSQEDSGMVCNHLADLPPIRKVFSVTECTQFKLTWSPPAVQSHCIPELRYRVHYKIYSSNRILDWKIACNNTSIANCDILISGRLIGTTIVYKVEAFLIQNIAITSSTYYYRNWPNLNFKPVPPEDCKTVINYEKETVRLTCNRHNRCFYGSAYAYNFYLAIQNQTGVVEKITDAEPKLNVSQSTVQADILTHFTSKPTTTEPINYCNINHVNANCLPLIRYGVRYKIYSPSNNVDWQYSCNQTRGTSCQIEINGRLIGATVVFKILAATSDNKLTTSSDYYRSWPALTFKPVPPKECLASVDYKKRAIILTCKQHDRCFYGSMYSYNFYIYMKNSSKLIHQFQVGYTRSRVVSFDLLDLDTAYYWFANAERFNGKTSPNSTPSNFEILSQHVPQSFKKSLKVSQLMKHSGKTNSSKPTSLIINYSNTSEINNLERRPNPPTICLIYPNYSSRKIKLFCDPLIDQEDHWKEIILIICLAERLETQISKDYERKQFDLAGFNLFKFDSDHLWKAKIKNYQDRFSDYCPTKQFQIFSRIAKQFTNLDKLTLVNDIWLQLNTTASATANPGMKTKLILLFSLLFDN